MKNLFWNIMEQGGKGKNVRENYSCIRVEKFPKVLAPQKLKYSAFCRFSLIFYAVVSFSTNDN